MRQNELMKKEKKHSMISGATKIFRVVGKLLLYRKKSMGKMGGNFINRQKFLGSTKD